MAHPTIRLFVETLPLPDRSIPSALVVVYSRALRLRCPVCGRGKLFRSWFRMYETCSECGSKYEREGGFFLGSIYVNYGLTALIAAIVYPILLFKRIVPNSVAMAGTLTFVLVFPVLFFPWSRSIWLAFDHYWDPRDRDPLADYKATQAINTGDQPDAPSAED